MNVATQLVDTLERAGIRYVFGIPGDENLPFVEAVRESTQVEFVLTRHEAAAGFMAAAHGHLTGTPAVAMSTLGAGATNLTTPVAHAYLAEMPMLVITGQKPVLDNQQGRYQLIDVVSVMRPITKVSTSVTSAAALPGIAAEALQQALSYPQGPAHIELPLDVSAQPAAEHTPFAIGPATLPHADPAAIDSAIDAIRQASRPLFLLGASTNSRPQVPAALRALLAETDLPFIATMMGKGVGDESSARFLGTAGMPQMGIPHCAVEHADLIVSVGHNVMEKAPFLMQPGDGRRVIHIHEFPATPDRIWFPALQVVGDMAATLDRMRVALTGQQAWDLDGFGRLGEAMRPIVMRGADDATSMPVKPQYVAAAVRRALGPEDIVSLDNGIHKLWMTRNYPALAPRTLLVDSALGAMGPGIPAAIVAALTYRDRRVVAAVGDGGFMMSAAEIETAVRLGIDLTIVVFDDGGLGMIRTKQEMEGLPTHGVDYGPFDVGELAASFGAVGHVVRTPTDLDAALATAAAGGVHVIDVPVDYAENGPTLHGGMTIDCESLLGKRT